MLGDGERRHVNVLFCDLAGSTALSERLDPEDLGDLIQLFHKTCAAAIERFGGHVEAFLGDGVLAYFGYPVAHEDGAARAVQAGLQALAALAKIDALPGVSVEARVGIHTGLVVAGKTDSLIGETPNVAARLQEMAQPNTVLISANTYRLVKGQFVCDSQGMHALKGLSRRLELFRVLRHAGARKRFDAAVSAGLTPLVGRKREVSQLLECWREAESGQGRVVLLSGEAGIGKSRLVNVLQQRLAPADCVEIVCQCWPQFENSAYYPVVEYFQQRLGLRMGKPPQRSLDRLKRVTADTQSDDPYAVQLLASLLSLPVDALPLSPEEQKQRTGEVLLELLKAQTRRRPVLLVMEDLQWVDPSTVALLQRLVESDAPGRMLVVLTARPNFSPPWAGREGFVTMKLARLPPEPTKEMVGCLAGGDALPAGIISEIVKRTDGIPLFIEESTKTLLEAGVPEQQGGSYEFAIPATLQDSLTARLDRLGRAKDVAQAGAAVGRVFSRDLLRRIVPVDAQALDAALTGLERAELVSRTDNASAGEYIFRHALIQEAAYQSLLKTTRRQYHRLIAKALKADFPNIAQQHPELLAHHYTQGGLYGEAIHYWQRAGEQEIQRSAHVEAVAHLKQGLTLVKDLADGEQRERQELALLAALGGSLSATQGYGAEDVERTLLRTRELSQRYSDIPRMCQALAGLYRCYIVRVDLPRAVALGEQILATAEAHHDNRDLSLEAERALGSPLFWLGRHEEARAHFEHGIELYDPKRHHSHMHRFAVDPGVACSAGLLLPLWLLGYPDQAQARGEETLALALELEHPFSLAHTLTYLAWLHSYRREWSAVHARARAAMDIARKHDFSLWLALGTIYHGNALAELGELEEGIAKMRRGMAAYRDTGAALDMPHFRALLAQALEKAGQHDDALAQLGNALSISRDTGERCWEPELYRLKGQALWRLRGAVAEVEHCFETALTLAREQAAKSLELRAAVSRARLWSEIGRRDDARAQLLEVCEWFSEGADAPDMQEARALLTNLVH